MIGAKGAMLKRSARWRGEEMERLFGMKIYLDLHVRVQPDWRENAPTFSTLWTGVQWPVKMRNKMFAVFAGIVPHGRRLPRRRQEPAHRRYRSRITSGCRLAGDADGERRRAPGRQSRRASSR